jgi:transposase
MISLPSGVRVWLACGHTDMRKGMDGLAMLAQQVLAEDPFSGALFAFERSGIKNAYPAQSMITRWASSRARRMMAWISAKSLRLRIERNRSAVMVGG